MDGRGGAFFADEIDDDTVLGSDDGIFAWTATYVGVFAGFSQAGNRIIDVDGFANWGNPGSTVDYDTSGFIGGALIGKKFKIGGVPLRIELDGMVGKVSATSSRLDPEGLDETVQSVCCQIATARAGIEQPVGAATIFACRRIGGRSDRAFGHGHRFRSKHAAADGPRRFLSRPLDGDRLGGRPWCRVSAGRGLDGATRRIVSRLRAEHP